MSEKKIIRPGTPFSHAVKVGNTLYVSGQVPVRDGEVPKTVAEQTQVCLENLESVLSEAEYGLDDIVKVTIMLTDFANIQSYREVYIAFFNERDVNEFPAASAMVVSSLFNEDWLIEIEAIAVKL